MHVDPDTFKAALARFPAGVTVVTTRDEQGQPWGFTASSFTSVSMDPPLVLVCLAEDADCAPAFEVCDRFAVNILGTDGGDVAWRFASRGADKFADLDVDEGAQRVPLLPDAAVQLEAAVEARYPGGDHTILVGRVLEAHVTDQPPLVFAAREFHQLAPLEHAGG